MHGYSVPDAEKRRLADAWLRAHYEVDAAGQTWPLRIGVPAQAMESALPGRAYLLITAWNPPGESASRQDNRAADARLVAQLEASGHRFAPALAHDGHGGWSEPGWLVRDVELDAARELARHFRQGGILHWLRGHPVRLCMNWPRPPGVDDQAHLIWLG